MDNNDDDDEIAFNEEAARQQMNAFDRLVDVCRRQVT
jgi:hypothetical protein